MKQALMPAPASAGYKDLLREGKLFTPIFATAVFLLYHMPDFGLGSFWKAAGLGFLGLFPLFAAYYIFDFPLFLRNYLWIPLAAFLLIWQATVVSLAALTVVLYLLFVALFYAPSRSRLQSRSLRPNVLHLWKLALKNSDSTSGNVQEQLPKCLLLVMLWDKFAEFGVQGHTDSGGRLALVGFALCIAVYGWAIHRYLFDWKPAESNGPTRGRFPAGGAAMAKKVIVIVIGGLRKESFASAETPFLDYLCENGTEYTHMQTVYPARSTVSFTSMLTGTYPREHGGGTGLMNKIGLREETIFDALRKVGKIGLLVGSAPWLNSLGEDGEQAAAGRHNGSADRSVIARAKRIMTEQSPELLVVHLTEAELAGYRSGISSDEYVQKIEETDELAEEFVHWLKNRGYLRDSVLVVCSDRGLSEGFGGHGHMDENERFVPFFLFGPRIKRGLKVGTSFSLISLAPTAAYLLGAPYPGRSRGDVLAEGMDMTERWELERPAKAAAKAAPRVQTEETEDDVPVRIAAEEPRGAQPAEFAERPVPAWKAAVKPADSAEPEIAAALAEETAPEPAELAEPDGETVPEPARAAETPEPAARKEPEATSAPEAKWESLVANPQELTSPTGWKRPRADYVPRKVKIAPPDEERTDDEHQS
ncbi:alkaline phosphatase family protein [Paenibacillus hamazuiensis]|uniref:alkaline phosphatase family protein n=1 Tax=Paenibacillus hamazuiensis TaxID=2936508 RepID=UPI00200BB481|nr:alkaline phosphatase family protein [Paenibacillus hamazuiensis]